MRETSIRLSTALGLEAASAGLGFAALLCWLTVCLVGSFRPEQLSAPYWSGLPAARTDTSGVAAFILAAVFLTTGEYRRLRRKSAVYGRKLERGRDNDSQLSAFAAFLKASCGTVAVLFTGIVTYISVNSITHPVTLGLHATHFMSWPAEGTLRAIALLVCGFAVGARRFVDAHVDLSLHR
jgi:hypothetical protein